MNTPKKPIEVFISYAHADETLKTELIKHLTLMKRNGEIALWHDRDISASQEWAGQIDQHLDSASLILLLISTDFIASDYCWDKEMTRAMERHEAKDASVVPIILRPADWQNAPFAKLQGLPKNAKPVMQWPNRDEAWVNVVEGLRRTIQSLV